MFVPRPETEWLLEGGSRLSQIAEPVVVDPCSGSGALAIGIAAPVPASPAHAVEKSSDAWSGLSCNILTAVCRSGASPYRRDDHGQHPGSVGARGNARHLPTSW